MVVGAEGAGLGAVEEAAEDAGVLDDAGECWLPRALVVPRAWSRRFRKTRRKPTMREEEVMSR